MPGEAAPAARARRRSEVQRSVQPWVSWQYQRMSSQASDPSGIIWFEFRRTPHIQHETTAARRPVKSSARLPAMSHPLQ
ncbi:MAG TPA: hypothetical protein VMI33_24780 [Streptosporangiaceae bacterium]|nr:hypothetical protein [Streptosporangiaceae bacterium]